MKKRILQVFGEPLSNGGQESFIMNMYRNIDRDKIQFDFYTPFYCDNEKLKQEIEELGGKIYASGGKFIEKASKKDFIKNLTSFLTHNKYEIIHIHSGSTFSLVYGAKIAKKSGAKKVIIHSHCGGFDNLKYKITKIVLKRDMLKYPTNYWACSNLAAKWKFPKEIIENKEYKILKNAIDTSKIYYSEEIREKMRKKMNLEDKFVVGHIGRFSLQKNHEFLIEIFKEIQNIKSNSELLLVGTGELQENIKQKVKEYGIESHVKFLGIRKDINELLNAMDAFILPSFFEGLPVVGIEAQSTGLNVFTSDLVTKELPIEELSHYYPLNIGAKQWANNIINESKNVDRYNTTNQIIKSGYDVKNAAKIMQEYYLQMI